MTHPLYQLVEDETQQKILTMADIEGFFVDPKLNESDIIHIVGASVNKNLVPGQLDDIELQVIDAAERKIGAYYIGRVELKNPRPSTHRIGFVDLTASFYGHFYPFPYAGRIWEYWSNGQPKKLGEWRRYNANAHASWLHVVQMVWFQTGHKATRYNEDPSYILNGADISSEDSFYCALGESINGPGGYFGSSLNALADCLSPRSSRKTNFQIIWKDFKESQRWLGEDFTATVLSIFQEFGVEVTLI